MFIYWVHKWTLPMLTSGSKAFFLFGRLSLMVYTPSLFVITIVSADGAGGAFPTEGSI